MRPHCGPSNGRLRLHVGLDVAPSDVIKMGLKVGGETLRWANGQTLAFDDSFEHEVLGATRGAGVVRGEQSPSK